MAYLKSLFGRAPGSTSQDTALNPTPGSPDGPGQTTVTLEESQNPEIPVLNNCQTKVIVFRDTGTMSTSELVRRINKSTSGRSND